MNCPHCGARNTAEAPWCTQCLRPLTTPPAPAAPESAASESTPTPPAPAATPPAGPQSPTGPTTDTDRPFRTVDGEVEWRCPSCDTWNLLDIPTCSVCGRALAASERSASGLAARVARARRPLWVLAVLGGLLMVGSIVLLLLALGDAGV